MKYATIANVQQRKLYDTKLSLQRLVKLETYRLYHSNIMLVLFPSYGRRMNGKGAFVV